MLFLLLIFWLFAKRCAKMHFFLLDFMFLNIVISLHSTKKEVRGTARENQDLVFSQFFKTRNYHTEVKLVCYTAVFSVVTHATLLPTTPETAVWETKVKWASKDFVKDLPLQSHSLHPLLLCYCVEAHGALPFRCQHLHLLPLWPVFCPR